jgi:hypothetical protein
MSERRKLVEGLKPPQPPVDPQKENSFVYGEKATEDATTRHSASVNLPRVPLSTRIRGDFAAALKRCSLERQLHKIEPNTLQDILEQAIEPWLKTNGYLP